MRLFIHAPSKNEKPLVPQWLTRGEYSGAAYVIRTRDLRFTKSHPENSNAFDDKPLNEPEKALSRPLSVSPQKPTGDAVSRDDLSQIVAAWPRLPDAIKTGILAMVGAVLDNA